MTRIFVLCLILVATCLLSVQARNFDQYLVGIAYNATVSKRQKTGPSVYNTLTAALAAAPAKSTTKYYIHITAGTYVERVQVPNNLTNIVLVGDGANKTTIQWNYHSPQYRSAETGTLTVDGDGFIAMNITFENSAGPGFQAAAAVIRSSETAFYKCTFLGFQDTLYLETGQQFFKECDIYGTVDFIFGAAAAIFQSCNIYARAPRTVTFTAQDKNPAAKALSGFVIQDCNLTVAPGQDRAAFQVYLGRPWSNYSTVVVMESYLDSVLQPAGWLEWTPQVTYNLTYLEFDNRGGGAATGGRVKWLGYHDVSGMPEKVEGFTVGKFINQDGWLDSTGVPFVSGFVYEH